MIQATAMWQDCEIGYGESESIIGAIDEAISDLFDHPMYPQNEIEVLVRQGENAPRFRLTWNSAVSIATYGI